LSKNGRSRIEKEEENGVGRAEDREEGADGEGDKWGGSVGGTGFHTSSIAGPAGNRSADFLIDLLMMLQSLLFENRKEAGVCE
jgi:hypothetical protein